MPDVVGALGGLEESDRRGDPLAHVIEAVWPRRAEERVQFGEGLFDRIEVEAGGREKSDRRAGLFDRGANLRLLVDRQVVEHDDVTWAKRGDQDLFDIGAKRGCVARPVQDRRGHLRPTLFVGVDRFF